MLKFEDFQMGSDFPNQYAVISKVGQTYSVLLPAVEVINNAVVELYASYADFTNINDAIDLAQDLNEEIDEINFGMTKDDLSIIDFDSYEIWGN
jgi:hypothetical protein